MDRLVVSENDRRWEDEEVLKEVLPSGEVQSM